MIARNPIPGQVKSAPSNYNNIVGTAAKHGKWSPTTPLSAALLKKSKNFSARKYYI